MSRAFVKEIDDDIPDELPELPLSPHPNRVTARGLALLRQRLDAVTRRVQAAAPDTAERALAEREGRWLQGRINGASVVRPGSVERVSFGAKVSFADPLGQRHRYRIVGEDEADPAQGRVSWVSPLARTLDGAQVGDVVVWPRPAGDLEIEVLAIEADEEAADD